MSKVATAKWALTHMSRMAVLAVRDTSLFSSLLIRQPLKSAWDVGEPWWPASAIRYLAARLPQRARVFEWGSGGSTVWFARRGAEVVAIESEGEWYTRVSQRVPGADVRLVPGTDSGTVRSEPALRDRGEHFFDDYVAVIDQFPDETFDVVVIDGIARCECAKRAVAKIRPNGLVVLDDTNWDHLFNPAFECFDGWEVKRVRGFKRPLDLEVSETTFFRRPV